MGLLIGVGNTKPTFPYDYYYGIEWDSNVANSACTRIGRSELHVSLPIQSRMRRCLLADDGSVVTYLHANDSTKTDTGATANLTGTSGQVMVEIPAHYRKFEVNGTKFRCLLSEFELPGFHFVPIVYRSAYEAALDRSAAATPKLASVVNTTEAFRGGNNTAAWDGTYRSLLGMPATSINLTNFRKYARNRGDAGKNGAGWNCDVYEIQKTCFWLYAVEYANFNCQLAYNPEPTSEGYKQGGLSAGVTLLSSSLWYSFNVSNPFIPCGYTNSLGNRSGIVAFVMPQEYGSSTVQVLSYRGLENVFGHIWCIVDGCKFITHDGGVSEFYVCNNPTDFTETGVDNYELRGSVQTKQGFVKTIMVGEFGENVACDIGASSTTFFGDYFDVFIPNSGEVLNSAKIGGRAASGGLGGLCSLSFTVKNNTTSPDIGTRLCFIP